MLVSCVFRLQYLQFRPHYYGFVLTMKRAAPRIGQVCDFLPAFLVCRGAYFNFSPLAASLLASFAAVHCGYATTVCCLCGVWHGLVWHLRTAVWLPGTNHHYFVCGKEEPFLLVTGVNAPCGFAHALAPLPPPLHRCLMVMPCEKHLSTLSTHPLGIESWPIYTFMPSLCCSCT